MKTTETDVLCHSPEAAVRSLQAAYRRGDLEAAVRCQDFRSEAILRMRRQAISFDAEAIERKARSLELSFRQATVERWPDFEGVTSTITSVEQIFDEFYMAIETGTVGACTYVRTLHLSWIGNRWSVLGAMHRPCTHG
ncbi:hypothetical protein JI745_19425 [Piscinibacter sp. HJYY11]|nr:hypothetical protein [Piscinibacter sp. HJYY11]